MSRWKTCSTPKRSKGFWFSDDPMMDAVTWAVLLLLAVGFFAGFGVGFGIALLAR